MKFGIVVGKNNKKAEDLSGEIEGFLEEKGVAVEFADFSGADFIISLGGDGTLIHTACANVSLGVPIMGINLGKLGFLTACEAADWQEALEKLIEGKFIVSERMTLNASVEKSEIRNPRFAREARQAKSEKAYRVVNEVVIKSLYRVVDLEVMVGKQKFLTATGDGIIVSTQTGSTAYSLSAGGPIIDVDLDCFVLTPVNAHGLPVPSVVLSPEDEIEIKVNNGDNVSLIIDGQEHVNIEAGDVVKIKRGEYRVRLVYFDEHHFIKALNAKFGLADRFTK